MTHKFEGKKQQWIETVNFGDTEWDIYKMGKQVVAFKGGTGTPIRVWNNKKDYLFTKKLLTYKTLLI